MYNKASASSDAYNPSGLFANSGGIRSKKIIILSGAAAMVLGTLLGQITLGAVGSAVKAGGNTGNGVLTLDVVTPKLALAQVGVYTVRCIAAAANAGTFRVTDPKGNVLGDVAVGATFANQIKFAIADGAADFIVGDGFDITISAGSGKYIKSLAAAVDGSQYPDLILGEDTVLADGADIEAIAHEAGEFNADYVTLGAGHTVASVREQLRAKGIFLA